MVKPLFNIVVIKAEYYEVYAEFGLLSCEHKIFIVMSTSKRTEQSQIYVQERALPLFFPPLLLVTVTIWLSLSIGSN